MIKLHCDRCDATIDTPPNALMNALLADDVPRVGLWLRETNRRFRGSEELPRSIAAPMWWHLCDACVPLVLDAFRAAGLQLVAGMGFGAPGSEPHRAPFVPAVPVGILAPEPRDFLEAADDGAPVEINVVMFAHEGGGDIPRVCAACFAKRDSDGKLVHAPGCGPAHVAKR